MRNHRTPIAGPMLSRAALLFSLTLFATPALAQYIGSAPPPPLPAAPRAGEVESPAALLARAVRTLAQSPRDFRALINAGHAAVDLGDTQAAIGFFGRAEEVRPSDPGPKIGMGAATVATGDARGALMWFFQAQQLGASAAAIGADRGLAQDLLGNQSAAQTDYRAALLGPERDEARRRLALSLGISGSREAAFVTLQPLLMRRDPAAQRVRAFVLALVGDERGASGAIDSAMPGTGARMAGFFRLLPSLSATQKAAAVHLGVFPDPGEIRVAAVIPRLITPPASAQRVQRASTQRTPRSVTQPRFSTRRADAAESRSQRRSRPVEIARGAQVAAPPLSPVSVAALAPPVAAPTVARLAAPQPAVSVPLALPTVPPEPILFDPPVSAVQVGVAPPPLVSPAQSRPAPAFSSPTAGSAIVPIAGDRLSGIDRLLAQADELPVPPPSRPKIEKAAKAVPDVARARKAAEVKAAADAKKLAEKKRAADDKKIAEKKKIADEKAAREAIGVAGTNWVQLAGGANADRMGIEFRRLASKSSALKKRGGAVTAGKDYFRLLTGPFANKSEAQAFVNQLAKDGVDGFSWTRTPSTLRIEKIAPK